MRRSIMIAASVLVSAVFLWLALRGVPLADVVEGIRRADPAWTLFAYITVLLGMWARAMRWSYGLLGGRLSPTQSFHILNAGMLINQLPLRVGEVMRVAFAGREGLPLVTGATSIIVERLIDVVVCVLLLAVSVARLPNIPAWVAQATGIFGAVAVAALIVLIVLARYPAIAHTVLSAVESRLLFLKRLHLAVRLDEVLEGLRPLTTLRRAALTLFWTGVGWGFSVVTFYALQRSLFIEGVDLVTGAMLMLALASFSIAIPVSIASIGPFQSAVRVAGDAMGIPVVDATTLGFLIHGINIAGYATLGVIGMISIGASFRDVTGQRTPTGE